MNVFSSCFFFVFSFCISLFLPFFFFISLLILLFSFIPSLRLLTFPSYSSSLSPSSLTERRQFSYRREQLSAEGEQGQCLRGRNEGSELHTLAPPPPRGAQLQGVRLSVCLHLTIIIVIIIMVIIIVKDNYYPLLYDFFYYCYFKSHPATHCGTFNTSHRLEILIVIILNHI